MRFGDIVEMAPKKIFVFICTKCLFPEVCLVSHKQKTSQMVRSSNFVLSCWQKWGHNFQAKILKRGGRLKKMSACGVLKESLPQLFAWGAYYVSCQKRLYKMKHGFKGSIFKCQSWPALAKQPINV